MNKAQRQLVMNLIIVVAVIILFVFGFGNFKDYVNKTEAIRGFNQLGQKILEYRKQNGTLPSEAAIANLKEQIEGSARVGEIHYRAPWISIDSPPDTIVAYAEKKYSWLIGSGSVVLLLDGQVRYLPVEEFKKVLAKQQTAAEAQEIKKSQKAAPGF